MARQLLNVPFAAPAGGIINITKWKDESLSTVTAVTDGRAALINTTFNKLKSDSESYMLVTGIIAADGMPNYPQIGMCLTIDDIAIGHTDTTISGRNGAGGGGIFYCGPDIQNEGTLHIVHKSFKEFTVNAGSHTLKGGWSSNQAVRSLIYKNPNSSLSGTYGGADRHHQTGSHVLIYEIAR